VQARAAIGQATALMEPISSAPRRMSQQQNVKLHLDASRLVAAFEATRHGDLQPRSTDDEVREGQLLWERLARTRPAQRILLTNDACGSSAWPGTSAFESCSVPGPDSRNITLMGDVRKADSVGAPQYVRTRDRTKKT
jgi:hypothetical protein